MIPFNSRARVAIVSLGLGLVPTLAGAAELARQESAATELSPRISVEAFAGYLTGVAGEYVYNSTGSQISQLNWQIDNSAVIGGRVSFQALDWINLRLSGWSIVASDNAQDDFDWEKGFWGFNSWSDWSHSPDTRIAKAYQIDIGAAARVYESGPFEIDALFGYRFLTIRMNDYGGTYIYSSEEGFRDRTGVFPHTLGIAYQQWWHTPYIGLGATYTSGSLKIRAEGITSPFVVSEDKDHHNMRNLVFVEDFAPDWMVGATLAAEYAVSESFSILARAEYHQYFQARGGTKMYEGGVGLVSRMPKPAAGGDFNSLLLTVGLKKSFN